MNLPYIHYSLFAFLKTLQFESGFFIAINLSTSSRVGCPLADPIDLHTIAYYRSNSVSKIGYILKFHTFQNSNDYRAVNASLAPVVSTLLVILENIAVFHTIR
jgi:hypothetical protein